MYSGFPQRRTFCSKSHMAYVLCLVSLFPLQTFFTPRPFASAGDGGPARTSPTLDLGKLLQYPAVSNEKQKEEKHKPGAGREGGRSRRFDRVADDDDLGVGGGGGDEGNEVSKAFLERHEGNSESKRPAQRFKRKRSETADSSRENENTAVKSSAHSARSQVHLSSSAETNNERVKKPGEPDAPTTLSPGGSADGQGSDDLLIVSSLPDGARRENQNRQVGELTENLRKQTRDGSSVGGPDTSLAGQATAQAGGEGAVSEVESEAAGSVFSAEQTHDVGSSSTAAGSPRVRASDLRREEKKRRREKRDGATVTSAVPSVVGEAVSLSGQSDRHDSGAVADAEPTGAQEGVGIVEVPAPSKEETVSSLSERDKKRSEKKKKRTAEDSAQPEAGGVPANQPGIGDTIGGVEGGASGVPVEETPGVSGLSIAAGNANSSDLRREKKSGRRAKRALDIAAPAVQSVLGEAAAESSIGQSGTWDSGAVVEGEPTGAQEGSDVGGAPGLGKEQKANSWTRRDKKRGKKRTRDAGDITRPTASTLLRRETAEMPLTQLGDDAVSSEVQGWRERQPLRNETEQGRQEQPSLASQLPRRVETEPRHPELVGVTGRYRGQPAAKQGGGSLRKTLGEHLAELLKGKESLRQEETQDRWQQLPSENQEELRQEAEDQQQQLPLEKEEELRQEETEQQQQREQPLEEIGTLRRENMNEQERQVPLEKQEEPHQEETEEKAQEQPPEGQGELRGEETEEAQQGQLHLKKRGWRHRSPSNERVQEQERPREPAEGHPSRRDQEKLRTGAPKDALLQNQREKVDVREGSNLSGKNRQRREGSDSSRASLARARRDPRKSLDESDVEEPGKDGRQRRDTPSHPSTAQSSAESAALAATEAGRPSSRQEPAADVLVPPASPASLGDGLPATTAADDAEKVQEGERPSPSKKRTSRRTFRKRRKWRNLDQVVPLPLTGEERASSSDWRERLKELFRQRESPEGILPREWIPVHSWTDFKGLMAALTSAVEGEWERERS